MSGKVVQKFISRVKESLFLLLLLLLLSFMLHESGDGCF